MWDRAYTDLQRSVYERWRPLDESMNAVLVRWGRDEMKVVMFSESFGGSAIGGRLL